jgi:hypothetical protein
MLAVSNTLKPETESEFLELSLVLPSWQLFALEALARRRGMNVGRLLPCLIGNMLQEIAQPLR